MPWQDHYQVLGVRPSASSAEVQAAYRRIKRQDDLRGPRGDQVEEAYRVLADSGERQRFDNARARRLAGGFGADDPGPAVGTAGASNHAGGSLGPDRAAGLRRPERNVGDPPPGASRRRRGADADAGQDTEEDATSGARPSRRGSPGWVRARLVAALTGGPEYRWNRAVLAVAVVLAILEFLPWATATGADGHSEIAWPPAAASHGGLWLAGTALLAGVLELLVRRGRLLWSVRVLTLLVLLVTLGVAVAAYSSDAEGARNNVAYFGFDVPWSRASVTVVPALALVGVLAMILVLVGRRLFRPAAS